MFHEPAHADRTWFAGRMLKPAPTMVAVSAGRWHGPIRMPTDVLAGRMNDTVAPMDSWVGRVFKPGHVGAVSFFRRYFLPKRIQGRPVVSNGAGAVEILRDA